MTFRFLIRLVSVLLFLAVAAAVDAYLVEPRLLVTERVTVKIPGLPENLEGFTIGVLSDLHLDLTPTDRVRRAAETLAGLEPDVVVVVGDFSGGVGSSLEGPASFGSPGSSGPNGGSKSPSKSPREIMELIDYVLEPVSGAYGVKGNWDRWLDGGSGSELENITMLINRGVLVAPNLWLCGADDALLGYPNIDSAVAGAPDNAVKILLSHEPDLADVVLPRHGISLQISGHSHGGQVRLPGIGPVFLPPMGEKYDAGLYQTPTHQVYTTRGIGMSHISVRFLCPPEITLITLTSGR